MLWGCSGEALGRSGEALGKLWVVLGVLQGTFGGVLGSSGGSRGSFGEFWWAQRLLQRFQMCSAWLSRRSKTTTWRSKAISRGQVGGQRRFFHGFLTLGPSIFAIPYSVFEGFSKFRQSARKTLSEYENATRNASVWVQNLLETLPRQPERLPRGSHEGPKRPQEASKTLRRWPKRFPKRFQKRPHGFQDVSRRQLGSPKPVREAKWEAQSVFLTDFSPALFSTGSLFSTDSLFSAGSPSYITTSLCKTPDHSLLATAILVNIYICSSINI